MPFPTVQGAINDLLQIWSNKISEHSARYTLTVEQVRQVKDDSTIYNHLLTARNLLNEDVDEFSTYFSNVTELGNPKAEASEYPTVSLIAMPVLLSPTVLMGIVPRNRELYNYLKGHPNRSEESLADLGILDAPTAPISPEDLVPTINGKPIINDRVELNYNRQGQKACRFEMRRGGGDWMQVGDPTESTFIDETPSLNGLPEKREYRGVYLKNNKPFGQYSLILTIYTTP